MKEPEATKLFIGQVPRDYTEEQLREVLDEFGEIYQLHLLQDKVKGGHKGCAFLTYYDNESAKSAQEELHEKKVLPGARGPMKVQPAESETAEENRKLFIGMISRSLDDTDFRSMFSPFGTIEDIRILKGAEQKSKGCGFVKYETRLMAQNAIKAMHNSQTMDGCTKPIVVKLADTDKDKINRLSVQNTTMPGNTMNMPSNTMNMPGNTIIGSASNALAAINPSEQPAYFQQLMAMPSIISNPALASAPATPGTIGALVAAMASQQQQLQQQVRQSTQQPTIQSTFGNSASQNNSFGNAQSGYGNATPQNNSFGNVQGNAAPQNNSFGNYGYGSTLPTNTGAAQLPLTKPQEGPQGANLFVYQIPHGYSDSDMMQIFMPFGNVISSKVFIDKVTGMSKGFGFISYDTTSSASAAISAMNGFVLNGKKLKVEVKKQKERSKPY